MMKSCPINYILLMQDIGSVYGMRLHMTEIPVRESVCINGDHPSSQQWPPLLTWFNFNPSMDK